MGDGVMWIDWAVMKLLFEDLEKIGGQAAELEQYAKDEVFLPDAFKYNLAGSGPCVLETIATALEEIGGAFGTIREKFDTRWEGLTAALALTCRDVERTDDSSAHDFVHDLLKELGL